MAETLLKAKERLYNATSEVRDSFTPTAKLQDTAEYNSVKCFTSTDCPLLVLFFLFQSSLSVGSDIDLSDPPNSGFSLRKSWDSTQEGVGLEVILQRKKRWFYTELLFFLLFFYIWFPFETTDSYPEVAKPRLLPIKKMSPCCHVSCKSTLPFQDIFESKKMFQLQCISKQ